MTSQQARRSERDHVIRSRVHSARGLKGTPRGRILVDLSVVKRPIRTEERTSLAKLPDTPELRQREHAVVLSGAPGKHSKRDVSMSWRAGKARVLRRGEAEAAPAGRDITAMEPHYRKQRLLHNAEVTMRRMQRAIDKGNVAATMKHFGILRETQALISLIDEQIARINT